MKKLIAHTKKLFTFIGIALSVLFVGAWVFNIFVYEFLPDLIEEIKMILNTPLWMVIAVPIIFVVVLVLGGGVMAIVGFTVSFIYYLLANRFSISDAWDDAVDYFNRP